MDSPNGVYTVEPDGEFRISRLDLDPASPEGMIVSGVPIAFPRSPDTSYAAVQHLFKEDRPVLKQQATEPTHLTPVQLQQRHQAGLLAATNRIFDIPTQVPPLNAQLKDHKVFKDIKPRPVCSHVKAGPLSAW